MLPEIISLNKSVSCRLDEYQELLDDVDTPSSDMIELWVSFFQDLSIIGVNWRALWILTEEYCEKFKCLYPTAVIVNVFNWQELQANVTVLAVQEDIVIPSQLDVPVVDLHPLKHQDYDESELRNIEDWLDKCRYFMKNLWYPWDGKVHISIKEWCKKHLENRLLMHSDMKNGVFDSTIVSYLKSLLLEAQNFNLVVDKKYPEYEDEQLTTVKQLIYMKMLKTELSLFENPGFRKGMILLKSKDRQRKKMSAILKNHKKEAKLVWPGGNCDTLIECLNEAQKYLSDDVVIKVYESSQEALDSSCGNDIIFLPKGVHEVRKFKGIDIGGLIRGFSETETTIVPDSSTAPRAILFDCFGEIRLENLSISKHAGIVIQVFEGTVRLSNCRMVSSNNSTSRGIVVVTGSQLHLDNCELRGFGTGISLHKGSKAVLSNTKIVDCYEGIKMTNDTELSMHNVEISSCSTVAIRMESSRTDSFDSVFGDLNLLQEMSTCDFDRVTLTNNRRGNVLVKNLERILDLDEITNGGDSNDDIICIDSTENEDCDDTDEDVNNVYAGGGGFAKNIKTEQDMDDIHVTFQKTL